jgi:hypothetical protein
MTLDLVKIAPQIGDMIIKIKSDSLERREHLNNALDKLNDPNINLDSLKRKIINARTPWPVARLFEGLNLRFPAPKAPEEYSIIAADGSHIAVDRHRAAHCYLINIGSVSLHYGENPSAELDSEPHLYSNDEELAIKNEKNKHREQQIEGALLDARRSVEECLKLAEMAKQLRADVPTLALLDGSLVLFSLESFPDFVLENLLDNGLLKALDELKRLSDTRPLALASYISLPGAADVSNLLKIAICPQESVDCDRSCSEGSSACDAISGLNDRILFADLLEMGERSALFINPSTILQRYGSHRVYFFYLRVEEEIARVEVPEWVAMRKNLLELAQALVLDQCRKGQGYPVALSEAHEKAVVTAADREDFWGLVEEALVGEKLPSYTSIKSRSKRTRWI